MLGVMRKVFGALLACLFVLSLANSLVAEEVSVPINLKGNDFSYTVTDPATSSVVFSASITGNIAKATNLYITGVGNVSVALVKNGNYNASGNKGKKKGKKGKKKGKKGKKGKKKGKKGKKNKTAKSTTSQAGPYRNVLRLLTGYSTGKGKLSYDLSQTAAAINYSAACTVPTVEQFFAGVPAQFIPIAITAFLDIFPPGTTIEDAIAEVSGCSGSGSSEEGGGGSGGSGDINSGYGDLNFVIPFDACAPRKTSYNLEIIVDLSEVAPEILAGQPTLTVNAKSVKPQKDQQSVIKFASEGGGTCNQKTLGLFKSLGSYFNEKLDILSWKNGKIVPVKTIELYGSGYYSYYAKFCLHPSLTNKKETFILKNYYNTDAYGLCAKNKQERQELNGYHH